MRGGFARAWFFLSPGISALQAAFSSTIWLDSRKFRIERSCDRGAQPVSSPNRSAAHARSAPLMRARQRQAKKTENDIAADRSPPWIDRSEALSEILTCETIP